MVAFPHIAQYVSQVGRQSDYAAPGAIEKAGGDLWRVKQSARLRYPGSSLLIHPPCCTDSICKCISQRSLMRDTDQHHIDKLAPAASHGESSQFMPQATFCRTAPLKNCHLCLRMNLRAGDTLHPLISPPHPPCLDLAPQAPQAPQVPVHRHLRRPHSRHKTHL